MAKPTVNKSALVREYLAKYPEKMPSVIAQQITQERRVKMTGKYVATIKTKLKQAGRSAATATPRPKPVRSAARTTTAPATAKSIAAQPERAPAGAAGLSQHIANLKAASQRLGRDEA